MIYEKDLGAKTAEIASSMKTYNPDGTWALGHANQFLTLTFPNP
jgi:hypothetical protein